MNDDNEEDAEVAAAEKDGEGGDVGAAVEAAASGTDISVACTPCDGVSPDLLNHFQCLFILYVSNINDRVQHQSLTVGIYITDVVSMTTSDYSPKSF